MQQVRVNREPPVCKAEPGIKLEPGAQSSVKKKPTGGTRTPQKKGGPARPKSHSGKKGSNALCKKVADAEEELRASHAASAELEKQNEALKKKVADVEFDLRVSQGKCHSLLLKLDWALASKYICKTPPTPLLRAQRASYDGLPE